MHFIKKKIQITNNKQMLQILRLIDICQKTIIYKEQFV